METDAAIKARSIEEKKAAVMGMVEELYDLRAVEALADIANLVTSSVVDAYRRERRAKR